MGRPARRQDAGGATMRYDYLDLSDESSTHRASRVGPFERYGWGGQFADPELEEAFRTTHFHTNCPLQLLGLVKVLAAGGLSP